MTRTGWRILSIGMFLYGIVLGVLIGRSIWGG